MSSKRKNVRDDAALDLAAQAQVLSSMADLSVLLPEPVAYITGQEIDDLIDPLINTLRAKDEADILMLEGRQAKSNARKIMELTVAPLKLEAAEIRKQVAFLTSAIQTREADIRDELFSNPRVQDAMATLKGNSMWAAFAEKLEKAVPAKLAQVAAELLREREEAELALFHLDARIETQVGDANRYGKEGADKFFMAETLLKQYGFPIPQHKGGGAKGA